ncbi:MAG: OmpA family protein [Microscillaceae bacterium]|nr:OmpA family protein [Microscillaceae bacterium]MDW8461941.1 OmpA family protein [Cytophagales bacterium]
MKFLLTYLSICLINRILIAQNLVPNGSFEQYSRCPVGLGEVKNKVVAEWYANPKDCTPDFYHSCNKNNFGVPKNLCGEMPAQHGEGYVGMIIRIGESNFDMMHPYHLRDLLYREHIAVKLTEPLKANHTYRFQMYVALSDYSNYAIGNLGVLFTHFPLEIEEDTEYAPQILFKQPITMKKNWHLLSDTLIAKGNETHLIIGNFDRYRNRKLQKLYENKKDKERFNYNRAYYYFDNISLELIHQPNPDEPILSNSQEINTPLGKIEKGKKITLKNIFFDFDKAELLPASFAELDKLALTLHAFPKLNAFILGHTDSIGTEQKNQLLSEERAKRVVQYLEKKGISSKRLRAKGFGESQPIDTNSTPEGRQNNRRVEAILRED